MRHPLSSSGSPSSTTWKTILLTLPLLARLSNALPPSPGGGNHGPGHLFGPEGPSNGDNRQQGPYPDNNHPYPTSNHPCPTTNHPYPSSTPIPPRRDGRPPDTTPRYGPEPPEYRVHEERAEAVRQVFQTSWDAYYKHSFPRDSLRPVRGEGYDDRFVAFRSPLVREEGG